jgi:hypothetical protein
MFSIATSDTYDYVVMPSVQGTVHVPKPETVQQYHSKAH